MLSALIAHLAKAAAEALDILQIPILPAWLLSGTGGMAKTYTYDAAGNITGEGSTTFSYDARGRLTQVTKGSVTQYAINGLGQRVTKTTATSGPDGAATVNSVLFVYDEAGHLIGEYDGTGGAFRRRSGLRICPLPPEHPAHSAQ